MNPQHPRQLTPPRVAVLCAHHRSPYFSIPGADPYTEQRDARSFLADAPVIAHPPCRAWSRLSHFSKHPPEELDLARWCVSQVRRCGGVLEHPYPSKLWPDQSLPLPGERDALNGWTFAAPQKWWGHKAEKPSLFYIVGLDPRDLPRIPFSIAQPTHVIETKRSAANIPSVTKTERHLTPPELARWLYILAASTSRPK